MTANFLKWQHDLAVQASGFAGWVLLTAIVVAILLAIRWRWQDPTSMPRLVTRLALMAGFLGTLALLLPLKDAVRLVIPGAFVGAVAYGWVDLARRKRTTIALPHVSPITWIVVGGAALRVPLLFMKNPWYDETFTAAVVSRSLGEMWRVIQSDVHPPSFYLIEWVNVRLLGMSPAALRFPAFVCGVVSVYLIYRLGFFFLPTNRASLVSALLAAVLPAALNYSDDARMYSLLAMLVLVAALAVVSNKPRLFMWTAPLIPLTQNLGYLHLFILLLVALWVYIRNSDPPKQYGGDDWWVKFHRWRNKILWIEALVISVIPGALWLPFMLKQAHDVSDGFWLITTPADLLQPLQTMTIGFRVPNEYLLHVTGAVVGLTLLSLFAARYWLRTWRGKVWLVLVFGAPALAALVSFVWHPVYLDRAFLPCAMLLTIPWAYLLTRINVGDRRAAWVIVVPALAIAVLTYYTNLDKFYDYGALINQGCQGADSIFETKVAGQIIASYYSPMPKVIWRGANDLTQTLTDDAKQALGWQEGDIEEMQGTVCVLDWYTVHNRPYAYQYIKNLLAKYPPLRSTKLVDSEYFWLNAYVVRVS